MDVACVIPARFNSSRFPGKLMALANGKTILQRTVENAQRCKVLGKIFVATDDERIKDHVEEMGVDVLWTSSKPRDGTERLIEATLSYDSLNKNEFLVLLQGDHPCTNPTTIEKIVDALKKDPKAVMSTAAAPIGKKEDYLSPHVVKCVFDAKGNALYFSRSPIPYGIPLEIEKSVLPAPCPNDDASSGTPAASDSHEICDPPASLNFLSLAASAPAMPGTNFGRLLGTSRFLNPSRYNENAAFVHIGIYCYRKSFLTKLSKLKPTTYQIAEDLEQLKILQMGYRIKVAVIEAPSPSVDTPSDIAKLEEYLCQQQNTFS